MWLGAHTSIAGGLHNAVYEGREIGANVIQIFTSNQKQWQGREISGEEVILWGEALQETGIQHVMSHDSYLINLGSPDPNLLMKSRKAFHEEIERCHLLGIPLLNFHPGAATTETEEACLATIVESLLGMEEIVAQGKTKLLLEATAGQGTSVGHKFEHLGAIIQEVKGKIPIGVCIDTCHIFQAGYDIRTEEGWENVLQEFDEKIGIHYLSAFHLNDSQKGLGKKVDRHANLGKGEIGLASFAFLVKSPKTCKLPMYLETPGGSIAWKDEIAQLRSFV
jgi:deoxyribonuclease-4